MELVTDKTVVEVGKFYKVRCAVMKSPQTINPDFEYYVPVIGEQHNDNAFGFNYKHIHIDGRFCDTEHPWRYSIDENGRTNSVLFYEGGDFTVRDIVIKIRKCRRLTTGIKPPNEEEHLKEQFKNTWHNWARGMIGKSCAGKKCPHLGVQMVERDGVLVCPLHDLHGDIKTEKIIGHPKCLQNDSQGRFSESTS